jgi:hypothetical protein
MQQNEHLRINSESKNTSDIRGTTRKPTPSPLLQGVFTPSNESPKKTTIPKKTMTPSEIAPK